MDDNIQNKIYLLLENQHYLLITSTHAAFSINYFCDLCLKSVNNRICHRDCPYTCLHCYSKPPCSRAEDLIYCPFCNRNFYGSVCYANHKDVKNNICHRFKTCRECCVSYFNFNDEKDTHTCGKRYCKKCREEKPVSHDCFIPVAIIPAEKEEEEGPNGKERRKLDPYLYFVILRLSN